MKHGIVGTERKTMWLAGWGLGLTLVAATGLGLGCSASGGGGLPSDGAGADATAPSNPRPTEGLGDGGVLPDGASPVGPGREAGSGDSGAPRGQCSAVNGPECDLVLQNCADTPQGGPQQCGVVGAPDGGATTACLPVRATQGIPKGDACCVGTDGNDPCLKGLTCLGGDSCQPGQAPTGTCTPYCCEGDDGSCGADSDGVAGQCNLGIVLQGSSQALYNVCTYSKACRPLGVQPCAAGSTCLVSDSSGTARCSGIYGAGLAAGAVCNAANECQDGLMCLGTQGGVAHCETLCATGAVTPFDAGALTGDVGRGGCPAGTTCNGVSIFPAWLGICR